ncbi:hypothetical protein Dip510_001364 [Elusimicrobium posterum]|uniref:tetratricopeptide repeat protein n=1 Tax=Elusimicrobium posterum TaxID=3116653 RepID=UPI003C7781BA
MKKYLILFAMLFVPLFLSAGIKEGDDFYRQGQFVHALEEYEKAVSGYPKNAYLYYNIGNCYFKLDMIGKSLAYYQKAFELNPRDPSIRHNLNLALTKTGATLVPGGMPEALHRAYFFLSAVELKGLVFICFCLLGLGIAFFIVKRKGVSVVVTFAVLFICVLGWYGARYTGDNAHTGVITAPLAELHGGPGLNFATNATMPEGFYFVVEDIKDDWYLVVSRDNTEISGWVQKDSIIDIKEL